MSDMFPPRPTHLAHIILRETIQEGDVVIDATAGNGHDTVFLAECVGVTGRVLAFDVQESAIESARTRLRKAGFDSRAEFHLTSHARMSEHAMAGTISAIMFNLGYLPGEDHGLTTTAAETLTGLEAAAGLLKSGGVLSVVCYPGHQTGAEEANHAEEWMTALTSHGWRVAKYGMLGTMRPAPFLIVGRKP